jgi:hypothetical protein
MQAVIFARPKRLDAMLALVALSASLVTASAPSPRRRAAAGRDAALIAAGSTNSA